MNPYQRATNLLSYLPPLNFTLFLQILSWIAAFANHWVPHLRRRQIIREALGSSLDIKNRLVGWSSHNSRSRPLSMKFHNVWQHADCQVMKWYKNLSPMPTIFRSIQHRRNIDRPFYHEFLQITLDDGHICIVERMGEGIDADAVRWTGCRSHDIIQYFSPDQYNAWLHEPKRPPSEVITEVTFPRTFDLIDVLAICYTIGRHAQAKNYTLQRFNCYFLCCTILCILARRTVTWESQITPEAWRGILDEIQADLSSYDPSDFVNKIRPGSEDPSTPHEPRSWNEWLNSSLPNSEGATVPLEISPDPTPDAQADLHQVRKYLTVGICSLLDPTSPQPEEFLLTQLMSHLNEEVYLKLKEELAHCLWQERVEATVAKPIKRNVLQSTQSIIDGTARGSKQLSLLLGGTNEVVFPREQLDFPSMQSDAQKSFFRAFIKLTRRHINMLRGRYSVQAFEGRHPLWRQFSATIVGLTVTALTYPAVVLLPYVALNPKLFSLREDLIILDMCRTHRVNPRAMVWALQPGVLITQFKYTALQVMDGNPDWEQQGFEWNIHLANDWTDEIGLILERFISPGQQNVPGLLALLNSSFPGFIWQCCILGCVWKKMSECVQREIERDQGNIKVRNGNEDAEQGSSLCTVQEIQQRLLKRIREHAKRVDHFQLAKEFVVEYGMEHAMADIWTALPAGFRSAVKPHP